MLKNTISIEEDEYSQNIEGERFHDSIGETYSENYNEKKRSRTTPALMEIKDQQYIQEGDPYYQDANDISKNKQQLNFFPESYNSQSELIGRDHQTRNPNNETVLQFESKIDDNRSQDKTDSKESNVIFPTIKTSPPRNMVVLEIIGKPIKRAKFGVLKIEGSIVQEEENKYYDSNDHLKTGSQNFKINDKEDLKFKENTYNDSDQYRNLDFKRVNQIEMQINKGINDSNERQTERGPPGKNKKQPTQQRGQSNQSPEPRMMVPAQSSKEIMIDLGLQSQISYRDDTKVKDAADQQNQKKYEPRMQNPDFDDEDSDADTKEDNQNAVSMAVNIVGDIFVEHKDKVVEKFQNSAEKIKLSMAISKIPSKITVISTSDLNKSQQETGPKRFAKWSNYSSVFDKMTKHKEIDTTQGMETTNGIVTLLMTYDTSLVLSVNKITDKHYVIQQIDLKTKTIIHRTHYKGEYIKMKDIQQNSDSSKFAVCFYDDGKFRLRVFGKEKVMEMSENKQNQMNDEDAIDIKQIEEFYVPNEDDKDTITFNKANQDLLFDDSTEAIDNFPGPMSCCCFIDDNTIFVNLFHNDTLTHYHFLYHIIEKEICCVQKYQFDEADCSDENFPQGCFYNQTGDELYTFYRQGHAITVQLKVVEGKTHKIENFQIEEPLNKSLGDLYLIQEQALVAQCSDKIIFYKRFENKRENKTRWKQYEVLNHKGMIFFIRGNIRVNICTDEKIYFYLIDNEEFKPQLENVMYNHMACNCIVFGSDVSFAITYNINMKKMKLFQRQYEHSYKGNVIKENLTNAVGLSIESMKKLLIAKNTKLNSGKITVLCKDYKEQKDKQDKQLSIVLDLSEDEQKMKDHMILSMTVCDNERSLAVIWGEKQNKNVKDPHKLFIFQRNLVNKMDVFVKHKVINIEKVDENGEDGENLKKICMEFHFKTKSMEKGEKYSDTLLFAKKDRIIEFDYGETTDKAYKVLKKFQEKNILKNPPLYFQTNDSQDSFVLSNAEESLYFNKKSFTDDKDDIDIDEEFKIKQIKQVIYDYEDQVFYIVANMYKEKLGCFIIRIDEDDPKKSHYLMKIKNNLNIDDANLSIMRDSIMIGSDPKYKCNTKELVLSYKTIYTNTYNVTIVDISSKKKEDFNTIIKHNSFQLWESRCMGFLVQNTKDFVILNKEGLSVIVLADIDHKTIESSERKQLVVHSLHSANHLKIDKSNFIEFDFTEQKVGQIMVQQKHEVISNQLEFYNEEDCAYDHSNKIELQEHNIDQQEFKGDQDKGKDEKKVDQEKETQYENLVNLQINTPTLRELLLLQSLQRLNTQAQIMQFVKLQPKPKVFLFSFLELSGSNFLSILSFDSRSVSELLDERNKEHFSDKFPLFYKNKIQKKNQLRDSTKKFFYRSAVDSALKSNQITGVNCMINHIVKYQNNYITSYLFEKNLAKLIHKGVHITKILQSNIFVKEIVFDEWAQSHIYCKKELMPYNDSIFNLREAYTKIFKDPKFNFDEKDNYESSKVYKISYKLNLLPNLCQYMITDDEGNKEFFQPKGQKGLGFDFLYEANQSSELDIFKTQAVQDLIEYKWSTFSFKFHMVYFCIHCFYIVTLFIYITEIYTMNHVKNRKNLLTLMAIGNTIPLIYDTYQLYDHGPVAYFSSFYNWFDFLFIWSGVAFVILSFIFTDPFQIELKIIMMTIILCSIVRTLFFMRIITSLTWLVTLMKQVISKLKFMLIFLFLLIAFFSQFLAVIGIGNLNVPGKFKEVYDSGQFIGDEVDQPYIEYANISIVLANLIHTFRMSLGDFDFNPVIWLDRPEAILFWMVWFLIVCVTLVIFINFIIAEASALFEQVMEVLEPTVQQERTDLICESEHMTPQYFKKPSWYPRYIVIREVEA